MQKLLQLKQCQSTSMLFGTVCLADKRTDKFDKFDFIHKFQPSITTQKEVYPHESIEKFEELLILV